MAKTVGYPCAIATKMVLDGEIQKRGMVTRQEKTLNICIIKYLLGAALQSRHLQTYAHPPQN